ncbi:3439_t:CDS:2, partial [Gigaspora margarita]
LEMCLFRDSYTVPYINIPENVFDLCGNVVKNNTCRNADPKLKVSKKP